MQPTLTFSFPWSISAADAINAVAQHFGATVSINGSAPVVPDYIKSAVEQTARDLHAMHDDPSSGTEMSPAVAFGGLMNGAAGNVPATSAVAQSSADVAPSTIAHAAPPAISQTSAPASSSNAPTAAPAPVATSAAPAPANGVEFDKTGLPWDARIHSGKKSQTAAGEWRALKGADKSMVKAVELELRAKYPNGASGAPVQTSAGVVGASQNNTNGESSAAEFADQQSKKRAALEFANVEALRVAGPQMIDEKTLRGMLDGSLKSVTLSAEQNEWYAVYYAKRNAAFSEFMTRPNVNTAPPAAPATPAASPAPAVGADLDATGLPWDARINVPAKLKDGAGVWLQRFDITAEEKMQIMADLRATLAGNGAGQASTDPNGTAQSSPVAPTPPVAPIAITADDASKDFTKLMMWVVANQLAGNITATAGPDAAKMLGFASPDGNGQLVLMRERVEYWPYVVQMLQAQGAK